MVKGLEGLQVEEMPAKGKLEDLTMTEDMEGYLLQVEGTGQGVFEAMSQYEKLGALENFDRRLNEITKLQGRQTPIAVDSKSFWEKQKIPDVFKPFESMRASKPECFEALGDKEQVERIAGTLENMEGLRPQEWFELSKEQRLEVMQDAEKIIAGIENRKPVTIYAEPMDGGNMGYFYKDSIHLNEKVMLGNTMEDYMNNLDTLLHEGRHAYQHYNVEVRQVHENPVAVAEWRENIQSYYSGECPWYDIQRMGMKLYFNQPIEYDARIFAGNVGEKLQEGWGLQ